MSDDRYLLPQPPPKPPVEEKPHPIRIRLDVLALIVAVSSVSFSGMQWWVGRIQAEAAQEQVRLAERAANEQREDAIQSRAAAHESAAAAKKLADVASQSLIITGRSARAAELSAAAGREALEVSKQTLLVSDRPLLETLNARIIGKLDPGTVGAVNTETINMGKGAAHDVYVMQVVVVSRTIQRGLPITKPTRSDVLSPATVGGIRSRIEVASQFGPYTESQIKQIRDGDVILQVLGNVQYSQKTMDSPLVRNYRYCYYYVPEIGDTGVSRFSTCPEYSGK